MTRGGGESALHVAIRELKQGRGRELMKQHGAHAIGIGRRKEDAAADDLALLVYVEPGAAPGEPVPTSILHHPEGGGAPVRVPIRVVVSPKATRE